jgi:hypothetical protein
MGTGLLGDVLRCKVPFAPGLFWTCFCKKSKQEERLGTVVADPIPCQMITIGSRPSILRRVKEQEHKLVKLIVRVPGLSDYHLL